MTSYHRCWWLPTPTNTSKRFILICEQRETIQANYSSRLDHFPSFPQFLGWTFKKTWNHHPDIKILVAPILLIATHRRLSCCWPAQYPARRSSNAWSSLRISAFLVTVVLYRSFLQGGPKNQLYIDGVTTPTHGRINGVLGWNYPYKYKLQPYL